MCPQNVDSKGVLSRLSGPVVSRNPCESVLMGSSSPLLCSLEVPWLLTRTGAFQTKAVHTSAHPVPQQAVLLRKIFKKGKLGRLPGYWKGQEPGGRKRQTGTEETGLLP